MQSVLEILKKCEQYFGQKGVPNPGHDAQLLLARALGCKRLELFLMFDRPLEEKSLSAFREFARRRARREPLQHILGDCEFFGIKLKSDRRALVPRHETEELCEIAAEKLSERGADARARLLDLGCGSGAIALALAAKFPQLAAAAADISEDALALARENLALLDSGEGGFPQFPGIAERVKIVRSNWFESVSGKFDVIAANPPYLTDAELARAEPEVRDFDPRSALVSADGGMRDLKKIISAAPAFLNPGGILICECGLQQPDRLVEEFAKLYSSARTLPDLSRRTRFALFAK